MMNSDFSDMLSELTAASVELMIVSAFAFAIAARGTS